MRVKRRRGAAWTSEWAIKGKRAREWGKGSEHSELWVAYDTQWTEGASACAVSVLVCCKGLRAPLLPTFTAPACLPAPAFSSIFQLAEKTPREQGSKRNLRATGDASGYRTNMSHSDDEEYCYTRKQWTGFISLDPVLFFFLLRPSLKSWLSAWMDLNLTSQWFLQAMDDNTFWQIFWNLSVRERRKEQDRLFKKKKKDSCLFFVFLWLSLLPSDRCSRGLRRSRRDRAHACRQGYLHFLPSRWKLLGFLLFLALSLEEN